MMRARHGFTLLELAVVLAILAVILVFGLNIGQNVVEGSTRIATQERLTLIKQSLEAYARHNGYLPCPADPRLTPGNADYGRESRNGTAGCGATAGVFSQSNVWYGAVPVFSLGLDESFMADAWNNKLTYMVSSPHIGTLASYSSNYARFGGTIGVVGNGYFHTSTTSAVNGNTPGIGATFAVISHGKNRKGAYPVNGTAVAIACPGATEMEHLNCDRISGQVVDVAVNEGTQLTTYFDDYVVWGSNATARDPVALLPNGCSGACEAWCAPCETTGRSAPPATPTRVCAKFVTRNTVLCEARCIWPEAAMPCP